MPQIRQSAADGNSSTSSRAVSLGAAVQNTNTYIYVLSVIYGSQTVSSVTDDRGNTYSQVATAFPGAKTFEIWRAPSGTANTVTTTVTYSGAAVNYVTVVEVSGLGTPGSTVSNSVDSASADPVPFATLTVSSPGIAFSIVACDTGSISFSTVTDNGCTGNGWITFPVAGGTSAVRMFGCCVDGNNNISADVDTNAARASESLTIATYQQASSGGGEVSHTFAQ